MRSPPSSETAQQSVCCCRPPDAATPPCLGMGLTALCMGLTTARHGSLVFASPRPGRPESSRCASTGLVPKRGGVRGRLNGERNGQTGLLSVCVQASDDASHLGAVPAKGDRDPFPGCSAKACKAFVHIKQHSEIDTLNTHAHELYSHFSPTGHTFLHTHTHHPHTHSHHYRQHHIALVDRHISHHPPSSSAHDHTTTLVYPNPSRFRSLLPVYRPHSQQHIHTLVHLISYNTLAPPSLSLPFLATPNPLLNPS